MIRGAVFDLDYTLYDRDASDRAAMARFCRAFPDAIAPGVTVQAAQDAFVEADHLHNYDGWKKMCEYLTDRGIFARMPDPQQVCGYWQGQIAENGVKYPFVEPMLAQLKRRGMKVGLITNGRLEYQSAKVRGLGLCDEFDQVLIGSDPATAKPHTDLFVEMARRLEVPCGELIYAGDHPINDVDASRRAGYTAVWIRTLHTWRYQEIPRTPWEADTVEDIPRIIDQINQREELI